MTPTKANNAGSAMVLTARDVRVLSDIARFRVLTRHQLVRLGHFQSKTRANAVLLRLCRFGYLSRRYQPAVAGTQRALYFLGAKGAALSGVASAYSERRHVRDLADLFLAHQLLVTDVHTAFHTSPSCRLDRWMPDEDVRGLKLGCVPDAHIEYSVDGKQFGAFVEVDRGTETLGRWRGKVEAYLRLAQSGGHRAAFRRQFFRVLVVGTSVSRLDHLRQTTARVTDRIFWFTTMDRLLVEGPLSAIWLRPVGPQPHALTEP